MKIKKIFIYMLTLILIVTAFSSCKGNSASDENSTANMEQTKNSLTIVTTIFPEYDWVCNITGSTEGVTYLEKSGADLHNFEPTTNDILTLSKADVFIYVGGISDKWVENAVKSAKNPDLILISLMDIVTAVEEETVEGMEAEEEEASDTEEIEYDEHVWLSVRNAKKIVAKISEVLQSADPENAQTYKANTNDYLEKLTELDTQFTDMVASASVKTLVFADRFPFRYLVDDYGLSYYAAFVGCSAESEASFETMSFLIDKTKELGLSTILTIEGSDGKIADTVSNATGANILILNSCQSVTEEDISNGMTYLTIMVTNLEVLREALG